MLALSILAVANAASGVHLIATKDDWWDSARGVVRIALGAILIVINASAVVRGKPANQEPDTSAEQSTSPEIEQ
jgi:hypothetical protein